MITRYDASTIYLPTAAELPYSDGVPVDNEFQNLIPNLLRSILSFAWQGRADWFFGVDMGIYYDPQKPAVAPDAFLSLGVDRCKGGDDGRLSYVLWEEDYVVPILAIETVSKTYGGEYEKKSDIYAQMGVLYYAVFLIKPKSRRGHQIFEVYRLVDGEYQLLPGDRVWMPEIGLALGRELDIYDAHVRNWLYWYDKLGNRLPTPEELGTLTNQERERANQERERANQERERANQERERANQERERADRLAQKLRELGLDPEEFS